MSPEHFGYRVTWSPGDSEYVGLCIEFPSLAWLAPTPDVALSGIRQLVAETLVDMHANCEVSPEPSAEKHPSSGLPELSRAWATLQSYAPIHRIRNQADFERIHALANELSDEVGDDENHPLFSLFEVVMDLIERWEDDQVTMPEADG